MNKLFDKKVCDNDNKEYIAKNKEKWKLNFLVTALSNRTNDWVYENNCVSAQMLDCSISNKKLQITAINIFFKYGQEKINCIQLSFNLSIPKEFNQVDYTIPSKDKNQYVIELSRDVFHKNRIFFEKQFSKYDVPEDISDILIKFFNLDDSLTKLTNDKKKFFFCGYYRKNIKDDLIKDIYKLIQKYTIEEEDNIAISENKK